MIKKTYLILTLFLCTISFVNKGSAEIPKNIQDAYKDFKKDIENLNNKIGKTENQKDTKLQGIDEALLKINEMVSLVDQAYEKNNFNLIQSNLNFLSTMIAKTSSLIPNEYESDLSKIEIEKMKDFDPKIITDISSSMKSKKTDKNETLLEDMVTLKKSGVDVFKINSDLSKKGISIINTEEISQVMAKNPDNKKLKSDIIKELKSSGVTNEELIQVEKGVAVVSLQPISQIPQEIPQDTRNKKIDEKTTLSPIKIDPVKPSEERIDSITTAKTLSSLGLNNVDDRQTTGVPYAEFSKMENELYSQIKTAGFNKEQSEQVIFNLKTKYVDVWFHAKEVYENVLTKGGTITDAKSAQQDWLNTGGGSFGLKNWIDLFNKNTSPTQVIRYSLQDYLKELNPNQIKVELASSNRIAKEAEARVLSYFTIDDPTGDRRSAGKIVEEAKVINNKVKESAMKYGISAEKAGMLASNAATSYLDTWYAGTLVAEGQLAKGYKWEGKNGADEAVVKWWNSLPQNSYMKQWDAKLYNPSDKIDFDDDELDYIPNDEALQKWFSNLKDSDFKKLDPSKERINSEAFARTLSYLQFDDKGNVTGDIVKEAELVKNSIINQATKNGYDKIQAEILAKNAATRYLDIWFKGTVVSESELAKGNTWKEADEAVDKWANSLTGEMKGWADLLYGDNERFKADPNFFAKLDKYFKDLGFRPPEIVKPPKNPTPITAPSPGTPWDPNQTIAQNKNRTVEMGTIKSNTGLSNVMNSMSDRQVRGLLQSGVINNQLAKEYMKDGIIIAELNLLDNLQEAKRQMKMSSIKSNELLTKVMNSLSDRQTYELIASSILPSDMVKEYIKNGSNAPILPCGSPGCSMIDYKYTKTGNIPEPGPFSPSEIAKDLKGTGNFEGLSAAAALGSSLSAAVAEIQASLNAGAILRGVDGQKISVQEALSSMPAGGTINPDGTLNPVQSTNTNTPENNNPTGQ